MRSYYNLIVSFLLLIVRNDSKQLPIMCIQAVQSNPCMVLLGENVEYRGLLF